MGYTFDWSVVWDPALWLEAVSMTMIYGLATIVIGLILGFFLGLVQISRFNIARRCVALFIGVFRCTPVLIQIVWFYYAFPMVLNVNLPAWFAAGCGLTFYMAAFSAEIFRGGIESIERGQWHASRSLCLSYWQTMRHIILPQAFRRMTPAIVNQSIIQIKNTSLLSVIAVHDVMYTASSVTATTYRPLEIFTFAGLLYILIIWPLASVARQVEKRYDTSKHKELSISALYSN